MATLSSTIRESCGSLTMYVFNLTSVTDGDTFASGLGENVVGYICNSTANVTQGDEGVNVSNSSGTFTFGLSGAASSLNLLVFART